MFGFRAPFTARVGGWLNWANNTRAIRSKCRRPDSTSLPIDLKPKHISLAFQCREPFTFADCYGSLACLCEAIGEGWSIVLYVCSYDIRFTNFFDFNGFVIDIFTPHLHDREPKIGVKVPIIHCLFPCIQRCYIPSSFKYTGFFFVNFVRWVTCEQRV